MWKLGALTKWVMGGIKSSTERIESFGAKNSIGFFRAQKMSPFESDLQVERLIYKIYIDLADP